MALLNWDLCLYLMQMAVNWMNIPGPEQYQVTDVCRDCGQTVNPLDTGDHLVLDVTNTPDLPAHTPESRVIVLIGCEGGIGINPIWGGLPFNGWQSEPPGQPAWDGTGVSPY